MMRTERSDPMVPQPYRVRRVRHEIPETFTLALEPEDGSMIPPFATGQFNMLYVFGVGEIPISISGNPTKPGPLVHTIRAVGTVSRMMQKLKPKDVIGVRGPFGNHWPIEQATGKDIVIVAGGIGLAPLRPTLYQIIAQRKRYGRVSLIYGARTPDDILYRKECERWQKQSDLDVYLTVDRATSSWEGSVGLVTKLIPRASFDPHKTMALICGPEVMMRFSALELEKRGVPGENIFLSMERNMKCAIGFCGHCQYSGSFVCKDGPIFSYGSIQDLLVKREI
jgi:NAD(P)H-flavin reductase